MSAARRPRVVVVGDAGLDVVASHDGQLAVGSDTRAQVRVTEGGAGANTAEWLVACGVHAVLVGRVGADTAGRQVREQLEAAGVECVLAVDSGAATCVVVVVVDAAGNRTMLPDRGASAQLRADDLDRVVLAGAAHLHVSGYVLLDPSSRAAGRAALAAARDAGLTTSVDPQAAALLSDVDQFLADVSGVDLLLPNADELRVLTGSPDIAGAASLLDHVRVIAATDGANGAAWLDSAGIVRAAAPETPCVDPTGCGDAFNAGLLAAWLAGAGPADALERGVAVGALAALQWGARPRASD